MIAATWGLPGRGRAATKARGEKLGGSTAARALSRGEGRAMRSESKSGAWSKVRRWISL